MGRSFEHSCHTAFSGFCFESCLLWIGMSCLGCPSRSPWACRKPVQARRPTGMFPAHPCFLPACQLWSQHHSAAKRLCSCRPGKWTWTLSLPLFPTLFSFKAYAKGAWNCRWFQKNFNYLIRVSEKRQFKNPSYCVRFLETHIKKKKSCQYFKPQCLWLRSKEWSWACACPCALSLVRKELARGCHTTPEPACTYVVSPIGSELLPQHPAAGDGALDLDNKYTLFNKHLTRNADSIIKIPICFRKGFWGVKLHPCYVIYPIIIQLSPLPPGISIEANHCVNCRMCGKLSFISTSVTPGNGRVQAPVCKVLPAAMPPCFSWLLHVSGLGESSSAQGFPCPKPRGVHTADPWCGCGLRPGLLLAVGGQKRCKGWCLRASLEPCSWWHEDVHGGANWEEGSSSQGWPAPGTHQPPPKGRLIHLSTAGASVIPTVLEQARAL